RWPSSTGVRHLYAEVEHQFDRCRLGPPFRHARPHETKNLAHRSVPFGWISRGGGQGRTWPHDPAPTHPLGTSSELVACCDEKNRALRVVQANLPTEPRL